MKKKTAEDWRRGILRYRENCCSRGATGVSGLQATGYGYGYGYGGGLFYIHGFVLESMTAILPPAGIRKGARIQSESQQASGFRDGLQGWAYFTYV